MPAVCCLLGVDAGRPWNFYWIVFPLEMEHALAAGGSGHLHVDLCHDPAGLENIPPVLERLWYFDSPAAGWSEKLEHGCTIFPLSLPLAYLLPGMHQSSLGALMLLAGERVHPLWQTPFLPFLYVGAACFMSFGCVAGTTMLCCLVWKRAMDMEVLDEAARITAWLIFGWLGRSATARHPVPRSARHRLPLYRFAGVFWLRCLLIGYRRLAASPSLRPTKREPCFWATFSVRWAA
jgi:hypothetical protein